LRGGEPDFGTIGRPRDALDARERASERRLFAAAIHDRDETPIVALPRMVDKRDPVSATRDLRASDPAASLIDPFSDRIFEMVPTLDPPNDREILPVRRPIGGIGSLKELPGSSSSGRVRPGQRSRSLELRRNLAFQRDSEVPRGRDGEDIGARNAERPRLGAFGGGNEERRRPSFPGAPVQHRLPAATQSPPPNP